MPRRTHPRPRCKHARALVRFHRDRYIHKRWRLGKRIYASDFELTDDVGRPHWGDGQANTFRQLLGQAGPVVFVHPEVARRLAPRERWPQPWPFRLEPGRFVRNPFTDCSCLLCKWDKKVEPLRARGRRSWRRELEDVLGEARS